jgi:hypothetical protein
VVQKLVITVLPTGERWLVRSADGSVLEEFITKQAAVAFARNSARAHRPSELEVHTTDGTIEYRRAYNGEEGS